MKSSKKYFGILGCFLSIITIIILVFIVYQKNPLMIYGEENSKVIEYAHKNNLNYEIIASSEKAKLEKTIETFDFNVVSGGIEIKNYQGINEKLVIPRTINNYKVVAIAEDALKNDHQLTDLYLPDTLKKLNEENLENVNIYCYQTALCTKLQANEKLKVTEMADSEVVDFNNYDLDFEYNFKQNYELTRYTGESSTIIIPRSLNGYPVSSLNLKLNDDVKAIYVPATVTDINLEFASVSFSLLFWVSIIFDIIALGSYIIINLKVEVKNKEQTFSSAPLRVIAILYLLAQLIFSIVAVFQNLALRSALLIMLIAFIIYILLSILLLNSKKQIEAYDNKIKNIDKFIKDTLEIIEDLDLEKYDAATLKEITNIKELITYSDPVSSPDTKELETDILAKLNNAQDQDLKYFQEITKLINKRNRICKNNK